MIFHNCPNINVNIFGHICYFQEIQEILILSPMYIFFFFLMTVIYTKKKSDDLSQLGQKQLMYSWRYSTDPNITQNPRYFYFIFDEKKTTTKKKT